MKEEWLGGGQGGGEQEGLGEEEGRGKEGRGAEKSIQLNKNNLKITIDKRKNT